MKFNKILKFVSSLALSLVLMLGFVTPAFAASNSTTTIKLMAAASTRYTLGVRDVNGVYPINTLLRAFEDQHADMKVNVTYDSSGNLLNQMIADTTNSTDIFLSADEMRMDSAVSSNIIPRNKVSDLLNNQLVLVAKTSSGITNLQYSGVLDWLNNNPGMKIAVGDPAVVPAGTYTQQVFGTDWDSILPNANLYSNVTNVLNAVADTTFNNVNVLGSVYATDAKTQPTLTVLDTQDVNIIYPIGITNAALGNTARSEASQTLVNLLKADIANPDGVFRNAGFSPVQ